MNNSKVQKVLGKGLVIAIFLAVAAVVFGNVQSAHAEGIPIYAGQPVNGWSPQGDEIHWYRFEADANSVATINMVRNQGDLVPYLALRYHDGNDFQFVQIDRNTDWSSSAKVSAVLPVTYNGYWIEAASLGTTSGTFKLSLSVDAVRNQGSGNDSSRQAVGYYVSFSVDSFKCIDPQDDDGLDELYVEYSMTEKGPYGTAVDSPSHKSGEWWMTTGDTAANFLPVLNTKVGLQSGVALNIKFMENDNYPNNDDKLSDGWNTVTAQQLNDLAASGNAAFMSYPVKVLGKYWYEVSYSVKVEYRYGLDLS